MVPYLGRGFSPGYIFSYVFDPLALPMPPFSVRNLLRGSNVVVSVGGTRCRNGKGSLGACREYIVGGRGALVGRDSRSKFTTGKVALRNPLPAVEIFGV